MKTLFRAFVCLLPWSLRRRVLCRCFGYQIHPKTHIGLAWVFPEKLVMKEHTRIRHLTVVKGLDLVSLGEYASIGRLNWITAYPSQALPYFAHVPERRPELLLGAHASISHRHIIDCTERVSIGRFSTFAGFRSQILTHSIDLAASRLDAKPVSIGEYCFVATACTLLGGASLPHHSVLGANSLLDEDYSESYRLYCGVPAKPVAELDRDLAYFKRLQGLVI